MRHRWQPILPTAIDITVPWSVCLSVCLSVTFMHCAQTAEDMDTISFAYNSSISLPDRIKIWLNPFLPKFCPKVTYPCEFERRRHSIANSGRMVRYSAMVTMRYHNMITDDWC